MRQQRAKEQAQDEAYQSGYQAALAEYGLGEGSAADSEPPADGEGLDQAA